MLTWRRVAQIHIKTGIKIRGISLPLLPSAKNSSMVVRAPVSHIPGNHMLMKLFSFFDCTMKPSKHSGFVLMGDEGKSEKGVSGTGNHVFSYV